MKYRTILTRSAGSRKKTGPAASAMRFLGLLPVFPLILVSFLNLFLLPTVPQSGTVGASSLSGNNYHLQSLNNKSDAVFVQVAGIVPQTGITVSILTARQYVSIPSFYTVTKPWSPGIRAPPFHV